MARPKNDQPGPNAKERMANAFWDALEEKPYERITVRDVVDRAQVNRNAFYYHFQNIDDLAQWTIGEELLTEVPELIVRGGIDEIIRLLNDPTSSQRIERIRLVAGSHGSKVHVRMLEERFLQAWCDALGIAEEDLSLQQSLTIRFVVGGLIAAVASAEDVPNEELIRTALAAGIPERMFALIVSNLGKI